MFSLRRYARRPSPSMVVAVIAFLLASGGVAYATIPDTGGVIHGCYSDRTGVLRVIDTEATPPETCNTTKETPLTWNQQGIAGGPGAPGSDAASALIGRIDGPAIVGPATVFAAPNGTSTHSTVESDVTHLAPNSTIVARDLIVLTSVFSGTATFTLRDDGVDTSVSCTMVGQAGVCDSGLSSHTVDPGSELSLKITITGGSVAAIRFGWRATTP